MKKPAAFDSLETAKTFIQVALRLIEVHQPDSKCDEEFDDRAWTEAWGGELDPD